MPKPYSRDLPVRVVEAIKDGASRRDAAELFGISRHRVDLDVAV